MRQSALERELEYMLNLMQLPTFLQEYEFHPERKWRFDFAWPDLLIAAEAEGGTWAGGRHVRGAGFHGDCEKYNAAALLGWRVFRFTAEMIRSGEALDTLEAVLNDGND